MLKRRKIPIRMRRTRKTVMNPRTMMMRRPAMQKVRKRKLSQRQKTRKRMP